MLPDEITLAVDEANDATVVEEDLFRYETNLNRSIYVGENHSIEAKDTLTFYRTPPKPNGNFKGVVKTAVKFSRDTTVTGIDSTSLTAPIIAEVSFSIPVGVPTADKVLARQRLIALLDLDAVMDPLQDQLMI